MTQRSIAAPLVLLTILSTVPAYSQQAQGRDPQAGLGVPTTDSSSTPRGTASLGGVVTNNDPSPAALRMAQIVLIGTTTGVMRLASTDADGRFRFDGLPADHYTVAASKLPYLGTVAGSRRPGRPGAPIAVGDGQSITDILIRMPRGASISGVLTNEDGSPAEGVFVGVKPVRMGGSAMALSAANGPVIFTDSHGRYRIHGLVPGAYAVVGLGRRPNNLTNGAAVMTDEAVDAVLRGEAPPEVRAHVVPDGPPQAPLPVFYPGTVRGDQAEPIVLAEGQDRERVDFQLAFGKQARIEGTVSMPDGTTPPRMSVSMDTVKGSSVLTTAFTSQVTNGRFAFPAIMPGSYILQGHTSEAPRLYATTVLDVDGFDQSAIHLTLQPALALSGRLVGEAAAGSDVFNGRTIVFRGLSQAADSSVERSKPDGSFSITNLLPGRYFVEAPASLGASLDASTLGLQRVTVDGQDVTDRAFTVTQANPPKALVLTFGRQWQSVSGRILDAEGVGLTDFSVMLFPTDETLWITDSRRIVIAQPGTDGYFKLGGPGPALLPAGTYFMAAVTDVTIDERYDPLFLRSLVPSAISVTLGAGEQHVQDVRVR